MQIAFFNDSLAIENREDFTTITMLNGKLHIFLILRSNAITLSNVIKNSH